MASTKKAVKSMKRTLAVAVAVAALALAGCGTTTKQADRTPVPGSAATSATPTPSETPKAAPTPAPSGNNGLEAVFFKVVKSNTKVAPEHAKLIAQSICKKLEANTPGMQAVSSVIAEHPDQSITDAAFIIGAGAAAYCPQHTDDLTSLVGGADTTVTVPAPASPAQPQEKPQAPEATVKFGGSYTWENGLKVTVANPVPFTPSATSAGGGKFKYNVKFDVTILNNTGKSYDPTMFLLNAQSGGLEGKQIFDTQQGMNGSPNTSILNRRDLTFTAGFNVANSEDIILDVNPGYTYDHHAMFSSK